MPRISKLPASVRHQRSPTIATTTILPFLIPTLFVGSRRPSRYGKKNVGPDCASDGLSVAQVEKVFYSALSSAASCRVNRWSCQTSTLPDNRSTTTRQSRSGPPLTTTLAALSPAANICNEKKRKPVSRPYSTSATGPWRQSARKSSTAGHGFFDSATVQGFAQGSYLPQGFYDDLDRLNLVPASTEVSEKSEETQSPLDAEKQKQAGTKAQLKLLQTVRELEEKLAKARADLHKSLDRARDEATPPPASFAGHDVAPYVLSKEDYMNLVDLYFYTHQSRFGPDSTDQSPTPLILEDYSFQLSADFSKPDTSRETNEDEDEAYLSPLKDIERMLKSRKLREIAVMQVFVELLLDDNSSNRALFEAYKRFPKPGVAYLPKGIIRLFLQRMSTPKIKSERSMIRYLALIDDMQRANLPITLAEWSSAIYLAGRSFTRVTEKEIAHSFRVWREMEHEASVTASHVTFNILFDIAVRAGKYVLGETILREMHERGLRLNRLGRVSLIFYFGLRQDGDGVRKAYRDFIEAGEIVDTLVLNCVMASLINAQEPVAAEQVYERMKNLYTRLRSRKTQDGTDALFMKYPPPGSNQLNMQMASNSLGRVLLNAPRLRDVLPDHHKDLQASMPLTPDHITFRTLINYHASTSGDLDRLTVLMNDMTELFHLPYTTLNFQLLFKGFAIHGVSRRDNSKWTIKQLNLVWEACRLAIQASLKRKSKAEADDSKISIPTVQQLDTSPIDDALSRAGVATPPKPKALSAWEDFVIDLAVFPRERLKRPAKPEDDFESPYFSVDETPNSSTTSTTGDEKAEYCLPPADSQLNPSTPVLKSSDMEVRASKDLIIWLLRAYSRTTLSRLKVEEVWFSVRKLWRPYDQLERDIVVRVLKRALRECDEGGRQL